MKLNTLEIYNSEHYKYGSKKAAEWFIYITLINENNVIKIEKANFLRN